MKEENKEVKAFKQYKRKSISEMRPYIDGEKLLNSVSISDSDSKNGSPKVGDMIARNPNDHNDQWLVAKQYFKDNLEVYEDLNTSKISGLEMKYFILKPKGTNLYAGASRLAMLEYARVIEPENSELAKDLRVWVDSVIPRIGVVNKI